VQASKYSEVCATRLARLEFEKTLASNMAKAVGNGCLSRRFLILSVADMGRDSCEILVLIAPPHERRDRRDWRGGGGGGGTSA